ncbi:MAG TPA: GGDEF domain-containing protein [Thermoleophilia bacterium]|nr:GGDEF domain-containing protein [Thermoleophilia bacterium]
MPNGEPPNRPVDVTGHSAVLEKARRILDAHKLDITKSWLNLLIGRIDDIQALERFPTQESIRTSVQLIEGLADALRDETILEQFEPGGSYHKLAASLGLLQREESGTIEALGSSLDALEDAVWDRLSQGMRYQDREILRLARILRQGLHLIMTAAAESYHERSSAELDRLAHTDTLTALHNRRFLEQELERHVELYKRYRHPFAILMLDFDNLKFVNDNFGHAAGDSALQHLATLMRMNVRDVDIPCRFGGDEFIVLMPEADKAAIQAVGRRIADSVAKTQLKIGRAFATLQVSFGASACPEDGVESEVLLQEADAGLYRAKQEKSGRAAQ